MLLAALESWDRDDQFLIDRGSITAEEIDIGNINDRNAIRKTLSSKSILELKTEIQVGVDDLQAIFDAIETIIKTYEVHVLTMVKKKGLLKRMSGISFEVPLNEPSGAVRQRLYEILSGIGIEAEKPQKLDVPEIQLYDVQEQIHIPVSVSENVPGRYYITDGCIDCSMCQYTAHANIGRCEMKRYSYIYKQPSNEEEEMKCKEAMDGCPVEAIKCNL